MAGDCAEDVLAGPARGGVGGRLVGVVRVGPRSEAQGADESFDPRADRRIADAKLSLHLAEIPARPEEALEQRELIAREAAEPPDAEVAFEARAAASALEPRDGQLVRADRAGRDDVVWHRSAYRPYARARVAGRGVADGRRVTEAGGAE